MVSTVKLSSLGQHQGVAEMAPRKKKDQQPTEQSRFERPERTERPHTPPPRIGQSSHEREQYEPLSKDAYEAHRAEMRALEEKHNREREERFATDPMYAGLREYRRRQAAGEVPESSWSPRTRAGKETAEELAEAAKARDRNLKAELRGHKLHDFGGVFGCQICQCLYLHSGRDRRSAEYAHDRHLDAVKEQITKRSQWPDYLS